MSRNPDRPLADTLFISEFRDFARAKGPVEYDHLDSEKCALAQFGYPLVTDENCRQLGVPYSALFRAAGYGAPRFDLLADRLEALIADSPSVSSRRIDEDGGSK